MSDVVRVTRRLTLGEIESAYRIGVFPMAIPGKELVTWHQPPRRAILPLEYFHASRSLERTLKLARFEVSFNRDFAGVMRACGDDREETWISDSFVEIFTELHRQGKAHSVEVWVDGQLAGGTYGVALGGAFFAESKFHRVRDMSKVALAHLVFRLRECGFTLLDVQYWTPHLAQFGVTEISHKEYRRLLDAALDLPCTFP